MNQTDAPVIETTMSFRQFASAEGIAVLLPKSTADHFLRSGRRLLTIDIDLSPGEPPAQWLTVEQAAREHMADIDGISLNYARAKVSRACSQGKFRNNGLYRHSRRIDPDSFRVWRLAEREKHLDRLDADH